MPKIKKNKIEQCTKIFIYRDLNKFTVNLMYKFLKTILLLTLPYQH